MEGVCKYCGQITWIDTTEAFTQEEADRKATLQCGCEGGQMARTINDRATRAHSSVNELFNQEDVEPMAAVLKGAIELLATEKLAKITVDNGAGCKATMTLTSKGTIKINRSDSVSASREA